MFDMIIRLHTFYTKYRHLKQYVIYLKVFNWQIAQWRNKDFTEDMYNIWCSSNYLFIFYSKLFFYDYIIKMDYIFATT